MTDGIRYSVIIPVYGNRDSVPELIQRLTTLLKAREERGHAEAVFVVDGSPDDSLECLRSALAESSLTAQLISLSRNFGSFSAIRAGLSFARGDYVGVMAADLQEPPEILEAFFDSLEAGECDIALGQRIGRADPWLSSLASRAYWGLYRRFVSRDIPRGGVDVFGCTGEIAARISTLRETHTSLIGLLFWIGYRRKLFPYSRQPRRHGKSGWTSGRKLRYLLDSVYAFTDLPIILLQGIGLLGIVSSFLVGMLVFISWVLGYVREPGYTPLMIVLLASTSAILLGLGIVGSYVSRAYENSKGRPLTLVATHEFYSRRG